MMRVSKLKIVIAILAVALVAAMSLVMFAACNNTQEIVEKCTVTFMNGDEVFDTQHVTLGEKYKLPEGIPAQEQPDDEHEMQFVGWTLDANYYEYRSEIIEEPDFVVADITIYAAFRKVAISDTPGQGADKVYEVEFRMPVGEDFGEMSGVTLDEFTQYVKRYMDADVPTVDEMPKIKGYHFTGQWTGGTLTDVRGRRRVTAVYEKNIYTLTLHYLDKSEERKMEFRAPVDLTEQPQVDEAFIFDGWYDDAQFETEATLTEMPDGDVHIYAKYHVDFSTASVSKEGTMVYGDANNKLYVSGLKDCDGLEYTFDWTVNGEKKPTTSERNYGLREVGAYNVKLHIYANYKNNILIDQADAYTAEHTQDFEFAIQKATLTAVVTLDASSIVYGSAAPGASIVYSGFVFDETQDSAHIEQRFVYMQGESDVTGQNLHVGNYRVDTFPQEHPNYQFAPIDSPQFEVTRKTLNVTAKADDHGYGEPLAFDIGFDGFVFDEDKDALGEHWFTLNGADEKYVGGERLHVGKYSAQLQGYASNDYDVRLPQAFEFNVSKRAGSVKLTAVGGIYGATPAISVQFENVFPEDQARFTPVYSYRRGGNPYSSVERFVVGEYSVTATFIEHDFEDYQTLVVTGAEFSISKKPLNVYVSVKDSYVYGDAIERTLTYENAFEFGESEKTTGLVSGNARYIFRTAGDESAYDSTKFNVGDYTVEASGLTAENYDFKFPKANFSVTKKGLALSVHLEKDSILYGSSPRVATADNYINGVSYDGFIEGENARSVFGNDLPEVYYLDAQNGRVTQFHAGKYTATTSADPRNYSVTVNSVELTVTRRTLCINVVLPSASMVYGNKPSTTEIVYVAQGFDGFVSSTERDKYTSSAYVKYAGKQSYTQAQLADAKMVVDEYDVSVEGVSEDINNDYDVTYGYQKDGLKFSVTPATLTVTLNSNRATYTYGTQPVVTVAFRGFAYGETAEQLFGENANKILYRNSASSEKVEDHLVVGTYSATLDGIQNANYTVDLKEFLLSVTPKTLTVKVSAASFTYGDKERPEPQLTYSGFAYEEGSDVLGGEAKFSYKRGANRNDNKTEYNGEFFDAGYYTVTVGGLTSDNYTFDYPVTSENDFTVAKRDFTATLSAKDITYGAEADFGFTQNVLERDKEGFAFNCVVAYRSGNVGDYAPYEAEKYSHYQAGNYKVELKYTSNSNYKDITVAPVTFKVAKRDFTASITAQNITYGDEKDYSYEVGNILDDADKESFKFNLVVKRLVNGAYEAYAENNYAHYQAGDYQLTLEYTLNPNYNDISVEPVGFKVAKRKFTATLSVNGDLTYGEDAKVNCDYHTDGILSGEESGFHFNLVMKYRKDGGAAYAKYAKDSYAHYQAGQYQVVLEYTLDPNYEELAEKPTETFNVLQKQLTVTVKADGFTYGGSASPEVISEGLVDGDDSLLASPKFSYTGDYRNGVFHAGEYTVTVEGIKSDNYIIKIEDGSFTVAPAPITVTVNAEGYTYGDRFRPSVSLTYGEFVHSDKESDLGAPSYTYKRSALQNGDKTDYAESGRFKAGYYTIGVSGLASKDYDITIKTKDIVIQKAKLTVTVSANGFKYDGESKPAPQLSFVGFKNSENSDVLSGAPVYHYVGNVQEEVYHEGTYTVSVDGYTSENYEITYQNGNFTVSPREVTLRFNSVWSTYADDPQEYKWYTLGGDSILGEELKFEVSIKKGGENYTQGSEKFFSVGSYVVTVSYNTNHDYVVRRNNDVLDGSVSGEEFAIVKKQLTLTVSDSTKWAERESWAKTPSIDDDRFTLEGLIELTNKQEVEAGTYTSENGDLGSHFAWQQGKYSVKVDGEDVTANFDFKFIINITLDNSSFTVTVPQNARFTYDGEPHSFEVTATADDISAEDIEYTYSTTKEGEYQKEPIEFTDWQAGGYTVYYKVSAKNATESTGSFTVAVSKATLTAKTVAPVSVIYDGGNKFRTITKDDVDGLKKDDDITVTYSRTQKGDYGEAWEIKNATNSGAETVWFKASAGDNYTEASGSYTVTIAKATVQVPTLDRATYKKGETQTANVPDGKGLYTVETNEGGTVVGVYDVELKLSDADNYKWSDNTVGAVKKLKFYIDKATVKRPTANEETFTYNKSSQTYKPTDFDEETMDISGNTQTNANSYTVTVSLKDKDNYKWAEGEEDDDIEFTFVINKATVTRPTANTNTFTYDANPQTYLPVDFKAETMNISGNTQTPANEDGYTVTVSLKDSRNYKWATGSENDAIHFTFVINKATVARPTADKTETFTYNAQPQAYNPTGFDEKTMNISGNTQTNANVDGYTVTVSLKDKNNYKWADGNAEDSTFSFVIGKSGEATIDTAGITTSYDYNGKEQTVKGVAVAKGIGEDKTGLGTISYSNNTFTNVPDGGTLEMTVTLSEGTNYFGKTETVTITVNKATYTVYEDGKTPYTYNANLQGTGVTFAGVAGEESPAGAAVTYDYDGMSDPNAVPRFKDHKEGGYTVNYTISGNSNYNDKEGSYTVIINKAPVTRPTEGTNTFTYDATAKTYEPVDFAAATMNISDNNMQTDAGTYHVTVSLKDKNNYKWATDSEDDDIEFTFTIGKSDKATIDTNAITKSYAYNGKTQTIEDGAVAKGIGDDVNGLGTISYSNNSFKDVPDGGTFVLTVTLSDGDNYFGKTATVTITVNKANYTNVELTKAQEYDYNATAQGTGVTFKGVEGEESPAGAAVTYSYDGMSDPKAVPQFTNYKQAGYTVNYKISGNDNYNDESGSYTVTINQATPDLASATDDTPHTYGDELSLNEDKVRNALIKGNVYSDAIVTFSLTKGDSSVPVDSFEDLLAKISDAGTYVITISVSGANYKESSPATYTIIISPKKLTVTLPDNIDKTYDGSTHGGEGVIIGDDMDSVANVTYSYEAAGNGYEKYNGSTVPTFTNAITNLTVTVRVTSNNRNYTFGENGTFEGTYTVNIKKATLTVNRDNISTAYDGQNHFGGITADNVNGWKIDGDKDKFAISYSKEQAGTYSAAWDIVNVTGGAVSVWYKISAGDNYTEVTGSYTVTINKADITLDKPGDIKGTYLFGKNWFAEVTNIKGVDGDSAFTYTVKYGTSANAYDKDALTLTNVVDSCTVYFKVNAGDNYNEYTGSYKVDIEKATLTELPGGVVAPSVEDVVLCNPGRTLATVCPLGDNWAWKTGIDAGSDITAGEHSYAAQYTDPSGNYNPYDVTVEFTARKEKITISMDKCVEIDFGAELNLANISNGITVKGEGDRVLEERELKAIPISIDDKNIDTSVGSTYLVRVTLNLTDNAYFEMEDGTSTENEIIIKIKSVDVDGILYTIEDALDKAQSGQTIIVKHDTSFSSLDDELTGYSEAHRIIKSGVTLFVPSDSKNTSLVVENKDITGVFTGSNLYCKLTISKNLTVNGNFYINAARVNNGNDTSRTNKNQGYAEVEILESATVTLNSGANFVCYGYIYGEGKINALSGSTVKEPFAMGGYKGGTISSKIYTKVFPINQYALANIMCHLTIHRGSAYKVVAAVSGRVFISTKYFEQELSFIGNSSNDFVELCSVDSYMEKYVDESGYIHLEANGDVNFNNLVLEAMDIEMTTAGLQVPIPGNFRLTVKSGTATIPTGVSLKLLPGAELLVEENATLNIQGSLFAYGDQSHVSFSGGPSKWQDGNNNMAYPYNTTLNEAYRTAPNFKYTATSPAKVIIKGSVNVMGTFAADISGEEGATLNYSGNTTGTITEDYANYSNSSSDGKTSQSTITGYLVNSSNSVIASAGYYIYTAGQWVAQDTDTTYNITYMWVFGDGEPVSEYEGLVNPNTMTTYKIADIITLENATCDGWLFIGWYSDPACQEENRIYNIVGSDRKDITVYGLFRQVNSFVLQYDTKEGSITIEDESVLEEQLNALDLNKYNANMTVFDDDVTHQTYFDGWYLDEGCSTIYSAENVKAMYGSGVGIKVKLYAKWSAKSSVTLSISNVNVKYAANTYTSKTTLYFKAGTTVKFDVTSINGSSSNGSISSISASPQPQGWSQTIASDKLTGSCTFTMPATTFTITFSGKKGSDGLCLSPDSLITLADGTQKQIKDLQMGVDEILTFDHFTGQWNSSRNYLLIYREAQAIEAVKLYFSNGTMVHVVVAHGFFDVDTNQYEILSTKNVADYVGHKFYSVGYDNGEWDNETVELVSYELVSEYTECYSLFTSLYADHVVNGMLAVTDDGEGLYNFFDLDENMKYDEAKMQADIEKYGLFTYEDFSAYLTEEEFEMFNVQYLKVAVGKGLVKMEQVYHYFDVVASYRN